MPSREVLNIISLGAGVQSTAMALMCAKGDLPYKIHGCVFSDTQAEPEAVYRHLDWLEEQLPFPVYRVTAGNLETETFRTRVNQKTGKPYGKNFIPSFGIDEKGKLQMLPRKCTYDFKLIPIHRQLKVLAKPRRGEEEHLVNSLLGISFDEVIRMKPAILRWVKNVYPLIDHRLTRTSCLDWMEKNNSPRPPRSACVFCPYHSNFEWDNLKKNAPQDFQRAVEFEKKLWKTAEARNVKTTEFLHADRIPLSEVKFSDKNQMTLDGFGNECEGMCGI